MNHRNFLSRIAAGAAAFVTATKLGGVAKAAPLPRLQPQRGPRWLSDDIGQLSGALVLQRATRNAIVQTIA